MYGFDMKIIIISILSIISCVIIYIGCTKESSISPKVDVNLLKNPSFELNGDCSFDSWFDIPKGDSEGFFLPFEFSNDVPKGGGTCSVVLYPEWGFIYILSQTIPANIGNHTYEFSLWAKMKGIGGGAVIYKKHLDSLILIESIQVTDTVWSKYSVINSLKCEIGDSLVISVAGGYSPLSWKEKTYFDLIELISK
jgi:hypothetical protein